MNSTYIIFDSMISRYTIRKERVKVLLASIDIQYCTHYYSWVPMVDGIKIAYSI